MSDIKCFTHSCSYPVLSVTATPPIQTFRGFCLIIHYHYCRCVKSIRAGGEEEVAHSHLVIVSFDGMGEQSLTPPIGRIYYPFSKAHIVLLSLGNAPE